MRIISGIKPSGKKTIGNYIGAIRHYVSHQDEGDAFYFIADMHSLTTAPEPAEMRTSTLNTVAWLLAAGLDPERCTLFVQSHIGGLHAECSWILECQTGMGQLERMTQFKDMSSKQQHVSTGLFTYPVLQAADILLYDIDVVPVGEDQKQHIELTRDLAERFNSRYGDTFVVPEPRIEKVGGRVLDLQDPTSKMSTTATTEKGVIYLEDDSNVIAKKIRSAVTDSGSEVYTADDKQGISNLLELMSVATGRPIDDLEADYRTAGYGAFKGAVAESVVEYLRPVQERYREIIADRGEIERVLANGADAAGNIAFKKLRKVKKRVGLLPLKRPART